MNTTIWHQCCIKLKIEAWIKALSMALICGFSVLFFSSFIIWFTGYEFIWLSLIFFAVTAASTVPLFYFYKFKPSERTIAKRLDALGLEERVVTMIELKNKPLTYISSRQKQDTKNKLKNFNIKSLKIIIPTLLIIAIIVSAMFGIGMMTVSALEAYDIIPSGNEIIEDITTPELPEYEITYEVEGEGFINGELFLIDTVKEGEDGIEVVAEEMDGWAFESWSDGVKDPIRVVTNVTCNMKLKAIFVELEEGEPGEGEEGGDQSGNVPGEPQQSEKPSNGDPADNPPQNAQGSGQWEPNNQIIDGETWYGGSTFDGAYDAAMGETAGNGDISGDGQGMVGGYMNGIQQ